MGLVFQTIRLANFGRDDLEEIDANALVDSGAAELCVPQHIANQLRLKQLEEREVRIANGDRVLVPYVGGVRVEVFGRQTVTSAIVIGDQVLLGTIPMQAMDLVIHPRSLTLMPNPDSPNVPASRAMDVR
ncbi:clan AA aspartic protease [Sandarakinorhabdus sp.]|uniref:clan AA aspartic protease n=1 Tax=Sandarakinorhabdus sp. TaxID=1916663 RepID=UPI003F72B98A